MKTRKNIKPMLFSAPMVKAILSGTKNQTRRIVKPNQPETIALMINLLCGVNFEESRAELLRTSSPYQIGDILWVRENWDYSDDLAEPYLYQQSVFEDLKPEFYNMFKWKPSIHMPKEACRIFLKVTEVRVHPIQGISPEDAYWEGIEAINEDFHSEPGAVHADYKNYMWVYDEKYEDFIFPYYSDPTLSFKSLWEFINGKESWEDNPLVWAISFELTERPLNFLTAE